MSKADQFRGPAYRINTSDLVIRCWLPKDVRSVVTSAGKALGLLSRGRGNVYAGILLDHDLQQQTAASSDQYLSGEQVAEAIVRYVAKDVPILVHSVNVQRAPVMVSRLEAARF